MDWFNDPAIGGGGGQLAGLGSLADASEFLGLGFGSTDQGAEFNMFE